MDRQDLLAEHFEEQRPHLRAVAYRMLGSLSDAEDAVQEAWLRLSRTDTSAVENLGGWLTTVVARISLNMLRSRRVRREEPLELHMPEPVVGRPGRLDPEHEVLTAESVGLALLVVLDTLAPAERVAFVLHDVFAVPFAEIATMLDRSPEATRQLASRARRRVRGAAPAPDSGLAAQREAVDAFFAAGRSGDTERLLAVLHPDAVLRADFGGGRWQTTTGADAIAGRALLFADVLRDPRPATVNGVAGVVVFAEGQPVSVMAFTVIAGRITTIDVLGDPTRLERLDLTALAS